ncbi:MAG: site-specific integrase [Thiomicrospira sp.]|nr:MAG: site-specific integrase [Thiomicrospira sp.]
MAITKRGKTWYTRFTAPNGQRVFKSCKTESKTEAQEFEDTLKAELWRVFKLGEKPRRSFKEAVITYISNAQIRDSTRVSHLSNIAILDEWFGASMLNQIDRASIDKFKIDRLNEGVTGATVNRQLEVLRAILNFCRDEMEWIESFPKIKMFKEKTKRIRFLSKTESEALLAPGVLNEHTRDMAIFSLATGLRESNVTGLKWENTDIRRKLAFVDPEDAKGGRLIRVPLNTSAISVLRKQLGKHDVYVFTFRGKPVKKAGTKAWRDALKKLGIDNFRWHDLRHTWASWHVQNGTSLQELQELGGWSSYEMVLRYAHLDSDHLRQSANNVDNVIGCATGAKSVQQELQTKKMG